MAEIILQNSFSSSSTPYDSNPHPATKRQYLKLLLFKTSQTIVTARSSTGLPTISKHLRSLGLPLCGRKRKPNRNDAMTVHVRKNVYFKRGQFPDALGTGSIQQYTAPVPVQGFCGVIVQEHGRFSGVFAYFVPRPIGHRGKRSVHVKPHWTFIRRDRLKQMTQMLYSFGPMAEHLHRRITINGVSGRVPSHSRTKT